MTRYRALLVGNSAFPKDPHILPALNGPPTDVGLMAKSLADPDSGLFMPDSVTTVSERAAHEVIGALDDFFSDASKTDVLLFYYSGHGWLDLKNILYLCTSDTRVQRLNSTAVSSVRLKELVEASPARQKIIMLDCCHSGGYKGGDVTRSLANPKSYVLTSSGMDTLAKDAAAPGRASVFTEQLVEGLSRAPAGRPSADCLTIEELFTFVRDGMDHLGQPKPQFRSEGDGDLPIARRRPVARPREDFRPEAAPAATLLVSETFLDLGEVGPDDVLPIERVYVTARRPDGSAAPWTASSTALWVGLDQRTDPERLEVALIPQRAGGRANIEIRNDATGEVRTVRIAMRQRRTSAPVIRTPDDTSTTLIPLVDPAPEPATSGRAWDAFGHRGREPRRSGQPGPVPAVGTPLGDTFRRQDFAPAEWDPWQSAASRTAADDGPTRRIGLMPSTTGAVAWGKACDELADTVHSVAFRAPPIGKRGYAHEDVDDFLDLVVGSLRARQPIRSAEVHNVAFKKAPFGKRGYDEEEVDAFLDEVERTVARLTETRPPL